MPTTPEWWDRDCRLCMDRTIPTAVFSSRAMKGAVEYVTVMDEEVHAWHTPEEVILFRSNERARRNLGLR